LGNWNTKKNADEGRGWGNFSTFEMPKIVKEQPEAMEVVGMVFLPPTTPTP
jgi:hypothetical protein